MADSVTVLIVDDDRDFADMMQYWLKQRSFDVDVCYSGDGVVEQVRARGYDILFLDLNLPGVKGLDILRQVRDFSRLPVIIFSAYGTKEALTEATALGISGFFAKEKGFEEAARLIHTALRIHRGLSSGEGARNHGT